MTKSTDLPAECGASCQRSAGGRVGEGQRIPVPSQRLATSLVALHTLEKATGGKCTPKMRDG